MITRGSSLPAKNGRKPYPLSCDDVVVRHWVIRETTPDNPFEPHKHAQRELWFIMDGSALLSLDGQDNPVGKGDLIELAPWVEHGLRTEGQVTWLCLG